MALAIRLGPDVYRPAAGAALTAVATDVVDLKMPRFLQQVENGQILEGAVLAADLFNVLPDGTPMGDMLDGARDAAVAFLTRDLSTSRLNPLLNGGGTPAAVVATPASAPAGAAGAASSQVATAGAAASDSSQAAY